MRAIDSLCACDLLEILLEFIVRCWLPFILLYFQFLFIKVHRVVYVDISHIDVDTNRNDSNEVV